MIHADDYNRDPYGALWAQLTGRPMEHYTHVDRARVHEAVERALLARFAKAAKVGDARDERRLLEELGKLLAPKHKIGGTIMSVYDPRAEGRELGLEIIIRGKKDRGKTTTARLIEKHLSEEAGYADVKVAEDAPPVTEKDAWWQRFQKTRARPVRIFVETVK